MNSMNNFFFFFSFFEFQNHRNELFRVEIGFGDGAISKAEKRKPNLETVPIWIFT